MSDTLQPRRLPFQRHRNSAAHCPAGATFSRRSPRKSVVSVIRVATRILFSLRSWPLPPPHSAGIGRYVPTSVLTADSDCDFRLVTADSHIWKGYQGRSPWLV